MQVNKRKRIFNTNNLRGHAQKPKVINQRWKFNKNTKNIQKHKKTFSFEYKERSIREKCKFIINLGLLTSNHINTQTHNMQRAINLNLLNIVSLRKSVKKSCFTCIAHYSIHTLNTVLTINVLPGKASWKIGLHMPEPSCTFGNSN